MHHTLSRYATVTRLQLWERGFIKALVIRFGKLIMDSVSFLHHSTSDDSALHRTCDRNPVEFTPSSNRWVRDAFWLDWEITGYLPSSLDPPSVNAKMSFGKVAHCLLIISVALASGMPQDQSTAPHKSDEPVSRKSLQAFSARLLRHFCHRLNGNRLNDRPKCRITMLDCCRFQLIIKLQRIDWRNPTYMRVYVRVNIIEI